MSTYSINDYKLQLVNSFQNLQVIDIATATVEQTYALSSGVKISESNNEYVIESESCDSCFPQQFDASQNDTVTFNNAKMLGVTVVRIECKQHNYTFHLDECPVYLKYENSKLVVKSPADTGGTGACPDCVGVVVTTLTPCPQP